MSGLITPLLVVYAGVATIAGVHYARRFFLLEITTDRQRDAAAGATEKAAYWRDQAADEATRHQRAVEAHAVDCRAIADALLDLRAREHDCSQRAAIDEILRRYFADPSSSPAPLRTAPPGEVVSGR
jgi:hypothetical protein